MLEQSLIHIYVSSGECVSLGACFVLRKSIVKAWALCVRAEFIPPLFTTVPSTAQTVNVYRFINEILCE